MIELTMLLLAVLNSINCCDYHCRTHLYQCLFTAMDKSFMKLICLCHCCCRTQLLLNGLEEAHVLDDPDDDQMTDKHGCPAYVSPEILYSTHGYSGKAADVWSLGVVLYTMLIGQYPFHDTDVGILFKKIRHGYYSVPDSISPRAKCLIKNILRTKPLERLSIAEISTHPWFTSCRQKVTVPPRSDATVTEQDQRVPEIRVDVDDGDLFGDPFHKSATELKD